MSGKSNPGAVAEILDLEGGVTDPALQTITPQREMLG